jgi:hypothetical protein
MRNDLLNTACRACIEQRESYKDVQTMRRGKVQEANAQFWIFSTNVREGSRDILAGSRSEPGTLREYWTSAMRTSQNSDSRNCLENS